MKIVYIDDLTLDIFIKKELIKDINVKDKISLEKYLKKLLKTLKDKYDIVIQGFYDITIYIDKYYGIVINFNKDDDYYEYFKNQVDMKLIITNSEFMYKVSDIPIDILNKVKVLVKDNNIYLKVEKELDDVEMMYLLENSEILYKKD